AAPAPTAGRLRAMLNLDNAPGGSGTLAKLGVEGRLGALRVNVNAQANGDVASLQAGDLRVDGRIDADDSAALVALLGLDRVVAVDKKPGALTFTASGRSDRDVRVDAGTNGTLRFVAGQGLSGTLRLAVANADARALRRAGVNAAPLPVTLSAK